MGDNARTEKYRDWLDAVHMVMCKEDKPAAEAHLF
jgi:hypothetical protein